MVEFQLLNKPEIIYLFFIGSLDNQCHWVWAGKLVFNLTLNFAVNYYSNHSTAASCPG